MRLRCPDPAIFPDGQSLRLGNGLGKGPAAGAAQGGAGVQAGHGVKSAGVDRKNKDAVLDLLAIRFEKQGEGPEGVIELVLAGGGVVRLDVECIEAQLADVGGAWETKSKPQHRVDA